MKILPMKIISICILTIIFCTALYLIPTVNVELENKIRIPMTEINVGYGIKRRVDTCETIRTLPVWDKLSEKFKSKCYIYLDVK